MTQKLNRRTHFKTGKIKKTNRLVNAAGDLGLFFKRIFSEIKKGNKRAIAAASAAGLVILAAIIIPAALSTAASEQAAVTNTPENTFASSSPTPQPIYLTEGDYDPLIVPVQERLMELGYLGPAEPTDYFGPATLEAVKHFQRQLGNEQTGIIDDSLYSAIMSETAESYMLKIEDEGSDVSEVQERLYQMGYFSDKRSVTGHFGSDTQDAVKKFQSSNGFEADGIVTAQTFEALSSPDAKANVLSLGESSEMVRKYQIKLSELAYLTTEPDGKYGKYTEAAVKMFQDKNGLVADGYLGPATRELIDSGKARQNVFTIGDSGDTVKSVQKYLVDANYLTKESTTGYYGEVTETAVRIFQKNNKMTSDGKVGKETLKRLKSGNYTKAKDPVTGGGGTPAEASEKVKEILALARSKMGCPYVHGKKGPDSFDCTGLVYWVLNHIDGYKFGYLTPSKWRDADKNMRSTPKITPVKITSIDAIKPGDIVIFHIEGLESTRGHAGIASSDTLMIHAVNDCVKETSYKQKYWKTRFVCAWRLF